MSLFQPATPRYINVSGVIVLIALSAMFARPGTNSISAQESPPPAAPQSAPDSDAQRIARSFFGEDADFDEASLSFNTRASALALINPLFVDFATNAEESARRDVRRSAANNALEFRAQAGEIVWVSPKPAFASISLSADLKRISRLAGQASDSSSGALRVRIQIEGSEYHIVATRAPASLALIKLRNGRQITMKSAAPPANLTGDPHFALSIDSASKLQLRFNEKLEPAIEESLRAKRAGGQAASFTIGIGVQEGSLSLTELELEGSFSPSWWEEKRADLIANATMHELHSMGIRGLTESLDFSVPDAERLAFLESSSEAERKLYQRQDFASLLDAHPRSGLLVLARALQMRDQGDETGALTLLDNEKLEGLRSERLLLQADLLRQSARNDEVLETLALLPEALHEDPRYLTLAGLSSAAAGDYAEAKSAFEALGSELGDALAASAAAVQNAAGLSEARRIFPESSDAPGVSLRVQSQTSEQQDSAPLLALRERCDEAISVMLALFGEQCALSRPIELWVYEQPDPFARAALVHAHNQVDRIGAVTVLPARKSDASQPVRILLCRAAGERSFRVSLIHELCHAFLFAAQSTQTFDAPLWLHEGLAVMAGASALPSLEQGEVQPEAPSEQENASTPPMQIALECSLPAEAEGLIAPMIELMRSDNAASALQALSAASFSAFYSRSNHPEASHATQLASSESNYALAWALVWYLVATPEDALFAQASKFDAGHADKKEDAALLPLPSIMLVGEHLSTLLADDALAGSFALRVANALESHFSQSSSDRGADNADQSGHKG